MLPIYNDVSVAVKLAYDLLDSTGAWESWQASGRLDDNLQLEQIGSDNWSWQVFREVEVTPAESGLARSYVDIVHLGTASSERDGLRQLSCADLLDNHGIDKRGKVRPVVIEACHIVLGVRADGQH